MLLGLPFDDMDALPREGTIAKCLQMVTSVLTTATSKSATAAHLFDWRVVDPSSNTEGSACLLAKAEAHPPAPASKPRLFIACCESESIAQGIPGGAVEDGGAEWQSSIARYAAGGGLGFCVQLPANAPTIYVLSEQATSTASVDSLLAHEMTHAADMALNGMDLTVLGHLACSEVRAAGFAECESTYGGYFRRRCVRNNATISTDLVFPGLGRRAVDLVIDSCMHQPLVWEPSRSPLLRLPPSSTAPSLSATVATVATQSATPVQPHTAGASGAPSITSTP